MNKEEMKAIEYYQDKKISFGVNFDTEKLLRALGITEEDNFENHQIRFKTLLNIIEKLQKENEELKFEERRRIIGKYGEVEIHDVINRTLSNDYISVKKIKDKIKEEKMPLTIVGGIRNKKILEYGISLGRMQVLQELIEEREEK